VTPSNLATGKKRRVPRRTCFRIRKREERGFRHLATGWLLKKRRKEKREGTLDKLSEAGGESGPPRVWAFTWCQHLCLGEGKEESPMTFHTEEPTKGTRASPNKSQMWEQP